MAKKTTIITNAKDAFALLDLSLIWQPDLSVNDPVQAPIFISLDLWKTDDGSKGIAQLGLSVFDPCWLASGNRNQKISNKAPVRTVLSFGAAIRKARHENQVILIPHGRRLSNAAIRKQLAQTLAPVDLKGRSRNVVIIGHNLDQHLDAIKHTLDLDVCALHTVKAVFDIQIFNRNTSQSTQLQTLKDQLNELNLRHGAVNHAGHISRCALRVLFAIYTRWRMQRTNLDELITHLSIINEVANFYEPQQKLVWNCNQMRYEIQNAVMMPEMSSGSGTSMVSDMF